MSTEAMNILTSSYINLDTILYEYALDIFLSRILVVERLYNISLLCSSIDGETIVLRKQLLPVAVD